MTTTLTPEQLIWEARKLEREQRDGRKYTFDQDQARRALADMGIDLIRLAEQGMRDRAALIAFVRWYGEQGKTLPGALHAQLREALGDDFYTEVY